MAAEVHLPEINPNSSVIQQQMSPGSAGDFRVTAGYQQETDEEMEESPARVENEGKPAAAGQVAGALLSRYDVDRFRKSFLNIIYVAMLEEGYNKSYKELFNLVSGQVARREMAGPNSFLWFKPLLRDNRQNLETLSYFLCRSEEAERENNLHRVYGERLMLAEYFKDQNNPELATHFYMSCLRISNDVEDEGITHAQANCNMGDDCFSHGMLDDALEYYENYFSLCRDESWTNENGVALVQDACVKLLTIYLKLGDDAIDQNEGKKAVALYRKGQEFASASGLDELEAQTEFKLANSLLLIGSYTEAIQLLQSYREKCYHLGQFQGVAEAAHLIARALVKQGKKEEAIKCLQDYAEEAKKQGLMTARSDACSALAEIHNNLGNFQESSSYCQEGFLILREEVQTDKLSRVSPKLDSAMTQYGVCRGNELAFDMFSVLENTDKNSVHALIAWKNGRHLPAFGEHRKSPEIFEKPKSSKKQPGSSDVTREQSNLFGETDLNESYEM